MGYPQVPGPMASVLSAMLRANLASPYVASDPRLRRYASIAGGGGSPWSQSQVTDRVFMPENGVLDGNITITGSLTVDGAFDGGGESGIVNVLGYGADPTGMTDSTAAWQAAGTYVQNLPAGGTVYVPNGTYAISGTILTEIINGPVMFWCVPGVLINYSGTGDCFRMYNPHVPSSGFNGISAWGGGILGRPIIDGTLAGPAANGIHFGDGEEWQFDVMVRNFTGATAGGVLQDNSVWWTEKTRMKAALLNNTNSYIMNCGATSSPDTVDVSHGYNDLDLHFYCNPGQNGLVVQNGPLFYNGSLRARGNFKAGPLVAYTANNASPCTVTVGTGAAPAAGHPVTFSTGAPAGLVNGTVYYAAASPAPSGPNFSVAATIGGAALASTGTGSGNLSFTGSAFLTIEGSGGKEGTASRISSCRFDIAVETDDSGVFAQTINFGGVNNTLQGCAGYMRFLGTWTESNLPTVAAAGGVDPHAMMMFSGVLVGDSSLSPVGRPNPPPPFQSIGPIIGSQGPLSGLGVMSWGYGTHFGVQQLTGDATVTDPTVDTTTFGGPQTFYVYFKQADAVSYTATDASPAVFTITGNAPANGQPCLIQTGAPGGFTASPPGGQQTVYYVVSSTGSTFSLAASSGGTAVNSSSTGSGNLSFPYTLAWPSGIKFADSSPPPITMQPGAFEGYEVVTPNGTGFYAKAPLCIDYQPYQADGLPYAATVYGKPADAGHIHPLVSWASYDVAPNAATAETFPRFLASGTGGTQTTGVLYLVAISLPLGVTVNNLAFHVKTAGLLVTNGQYALLDHNFNIKAVTANQTSGSWGVTGATDSRAVLAPFTPSTRGLHYMAVCVNASTMPVFTILTNAGSMDSGLANASPFLCGSLSTGYTAGALATGGAALSGTTALGGQAMYAYTA